MFEYCIDTLVVHVENCFKIKTTFLITETNNKEVEEHNYLSKKTDVDSSSSGSTDDDQSETEAD